MLTRRPQAGHVGCRNKFGMTEVFLKTISLDTGDKIKRLKNYLRRIGL
jgi:hypothetical protein